MAEAAPAEADIMAVDLEARWPEADAWLVEADELQDGALPPQAD